jgi:hypothetical protein
MGKIIVDEKIVHKCNKEFPDYKGFIYYDGTMHIKDRPAGIVFRCSCGKLWVTRRQFAMSDYTLWRRAGLILRWKCRGKGYDEGY